MATALTYPGVYVEEVSSGVRTITGVATSIAAFVGYTRRGEPDKAVPVYSFGDFERSHGGLDRDSPLSYAVRQFFANGGTQALVVRVAAGVDYAHWVLSDSGAPPTEVLDVFARSPGTWADDHRLTVTHKARNPDADFNLVVSGPVDGKLTALETHRNLNMSPASPQFAPAVVNAASRLVKLSLKGAPTYTKAGAAVSKAITFPLAATDDRVIEGVVDGTDAFRIELPKGALPASLTDLVKALTDKVPAALKGRMAISASDAEGGSTGTANCLKIASTTVGANSRVTIAPGALGGLANNIGIGLANGGREFTGDAQHRPAVADDLPPIGPGKDGTKGGVPELIGKVVGTTKSGMQALLDVDLFNILCIPETFELEVEIGKQVIREGVALCEDKGQRAFYIVDPPAGLALDEVITWAGTLPRSRNAAVYFPAVQIADPLDSLRPRAIAPSGTIAGVYARTDSERGVWKAPAGTEATLAGVASLVSTMNDSENGRINIKGVNALRMFPAYGAVAWGARTLRGDDTLAEGEYKYVPVRRLALFLEESLYRGTQWVVFEPNDEPLWAQIRLNIGSFLHNLFRQGAFQGNTPKDAYFVKCDRETTTQADINLGIVNILVGFAPLRPAEFVILKLQQIAGDIRT